MTDAIALLIQLPNPTSTLQYFELTPDSLEAGHAGHAGTASQSPCPNNTQLNYLRTITYLEPHQADHLNNPSTGTHSTREPHILLPLTHPPGRVAEDPVAGVTFTITMGSHIFTKNRTAPYWMVAKGTPILGESTVWV
jgi:hypothetical protein